MGSTRRGRNGRDGGHLCEACVQRLAPRTAHSVMHDELVPCCASFSWDRPHVAPHYCLLWAVLSARRTKIADSNNADTWGDKGPI